MNTDCFICCPVEIDKTQETASQWFQPRYVCLEHKKPILKTGETIDSFLGRYKSGYLEGSSLGYFLNPVTINGVKGWADFIGGGYAVYEELFVSNNFFEFGVQTNPSHIEVLYILYKNKDKFSNGYSLKALIEDVPAKQLEHFDRMSDSWNRNFQIQRLLNEQGKDMVENPEEIFEILSKISNIESNIENNIENNSKLVFDLIDIGKLRFSYIKM